MIASDPMIAKMPTIAAMTYKYSHAQPFVHPRPQSTANITCYGGRDRSSALSVEDVV
jgi:citrate synthase